MRFLTLLMLSLSILSVGCSNTNSMDAGTVDHNRWIIEYEGKYGFIDRNGATKINVQFEKVQNFNDGLAPAKKNDKWGYIDTTGKFIISPKFQSASVFSNGLASVSIDLKAEPSYFYIDKKGKDVFKHKYYMADNFKEGLAIVTVGYGNVNSYPRKSLNAVINTQGKTIIPSAPLSYYGFSDGLSVVRPNNRSTPLGYMNNQGEMVIDTIYESANSFYNGLALVDGKDRKRFAINKTGDTVFNIFRSPRYNPATSLSNYIVIPDKKTGKDKIVGIDGKKIAELNFKIDDPYGKISFSEGLLPFTTLYGSRYETPDPYGYLDTNGNIAIKQQFRGANDFKFGLAEVTLSNGQQGYVNTSGKVVWSQENEDFKVAKGAGDVFQHFIAKGDKSFENNHSNEAISYYFKAKKHWKTNKDKIRVYASLTSAYTKIKDYKQASNYCNELLIVDSKNSWGLKQKEKIYFASLPKSKILPLQVSFGMSKKQVKAITDKHKQIKSQFMMDCYTLFDNLKRDGINENNIQYFYLNNYKFYMFAFKDNKLVSVHTIYPSYDKLVTAVKRLSQKVSFIEDKKYSTFIGTKKREVLLAKKEDTIIRVFTVRGVHEYIEYYSTNGIIPKPRGLQSRIYQYSNDYNTAKSDTYNHSVQRKNERAYNDY